MSPTRFYASIAVLLLIGCAGGSQPSPDATPVDASTPASVAPRFNPEVVTQAELEQALLGDVDALTVIKRLRPQFLSFRGTASTSNPSGGSVQVSIDNGQLRSADVLTSIRQSEIREIRYLNAAAAAQRFGSLSRAGPVILVQRR